MRVYRYGFLTLFILLAAGAGLHAIDAQSIWFDEGWSAYAAAQPTLLDAALADATNPPLYYVLLNISTRLLGDSEFGLRVFSLFLALLTIPLAYQLGKQTAGDRAGVYAAALLAVSAPLWWASQEARMYTLLAVLVLLMAIAWLRLIRQASRAAWAILLLAELGMLYAHNTGPVVVLWINAATLLFWVFRRSRKIPDWRLWIGGQIAVLVLWLPWLSRFLELGAANSAVISGPQLTPAGLGRLWQGFWVAPWEMVGQEPLLMYLTLAVLVLLVVVLVIARRGPWVLLHVFLLTIGLLLGLSLIGNPLHGRYLVMILPLLLVALATNLTVLRSRWQQGAILGLFALLLAVNIAAARNPAYEHDDARAMVQYYVDNLDADDTVLAWSYADRYELAYYWDRLGATAQRVTLPEGADLDDIEPMLPRSGDVALNVWFTQRADFRGMLNCVYNNGRATLPVTHTVSGMTNLLFEDVTLALPGMEVLEVAVTRGDLSAGVLSAHGEIRSRRSDEALCLPVQLQMALIPTGDLHLVLSLRNALGWEIASVDAPFATANQRLTSNTRPGDILTAYPLLRPPFGTPPGDYALYLRVYDENTEIDGGYDLVDSSGPVLGKELLLGTLTLTSGEDWAATGRETELPNKVNLPVSDDLRLIAHNLPDPWTAQSGQTLPITLLWQGSDPLPTLTLHGESWAVDIPAMIEEHDAITLDWRSVLVPADAETGPATLELPDGRLIAALQIESVALLDSPPDYAVTVDQTLGEVGRLLGYTLDENSLTLQREAADVSLVWQGGAATEIPYTVFVQLLNTEMRVIAQSDAQPAQGQRPTTGWREGEYILDAHQLRYNDLAAPGEVRLIVGLYDAQTGARLALDATGRDYIEIGSFTLR